jgi:hypothetical protein
MVAFIIVTDLFRISHFPDFAYTRLGMKLSCSVLFLSSIFSSFYRPGLVHRSIIMGLQLSHRFWRYLDWQRG